MSYISLSFRSFRKAYADKVPIAYSICSFDWQLGKMERGMAFGSMVEMNASKSAAVVSDLRIWSNETSQVFATAFCCEPVYRVLSWNSSAHQVNEVLLCTSHELEILGDRHR